MKQINILHCCVCTTWALLFSFRIYASASRILISFAFNIPMTHGAARVSLGNISVYKCKTTVPASNSAVSIASAFVVCYIYSLHALNFPSTLHVIVTLIFSLCYCSNATVINRYGRQSAANGETQKSPCSIDKLKDFFNARFFPLALFCFMSWYGVWIKK